MTLGRKCRIHIKMPPLQTCRFPFIIRSLYCISIQMIHLLTLIVLVRLVLSSQVSMTEVEDSFNKFMEEWTTKQKLTFEQFNQIKAEYEADLPLSDAEMIQECNSYVQEKCDKFRPAAYEIFLEAANNSKNDYYFFDKERFLWRKPDQDFEKVLVNGMHRNQKLLERKINQTWENIIDEPYSSLEKKSLWSSIIKSFSFFRPSTITSFGSMGKRIRFSGNTMLSNIMRNKAAIAIGSLGVSGIALIFWGLKSEGGSYTDGKIIPDSGKNETELIYRLGKKVLTDDVNVYCKYSFQIKTLVIWYGNWSKTSPHIETMEHLAQHISNSTWYSSMRDYYFQESENSEKKYVNGTVHFKKSTFDNYSQGSDLDLPKISEVIRKHLNGALPDPNGAYFVFGSTDIQEKESINNDACGYHTYDDSLADYPTYLSYIYVIYYTKNRNQITKEDAKLNSKAI